MTSKSDMEGVHEEGLGEGKLENNKHKWRILWVTDPTRLD
jgi:hypothetical protein